ncbi:hypothetical protein QCA50_011652 [Cerrena zonata]|uniref:Uncharacterized protein n=1 Tax=Cerrena zonata TaxID=2478898 RepID=A0AAW0G0R7_9APHY
MALKRKLSLDFEDDVAYSASKQQKLVPFPSSTELDSDVDMSDDSMSALPPLSIPTQTFHTRLISNASTASSAYSDSPRNSPNYPAFELYPLEEQAQMTTDDNYFNQPTQQERPSGLLQPRGTSFTHHGQNCTQIPKLRMACSAGPNGRRSMWAHCEQCGAIEMVDSD